MKASLPLLALVTLAVAASAQPPVKYAVSPAGMEYLGGNSNNTFPFQGVSSSYQQVHDAVDLAALNGGAPMVISGMHFRPARTFTIPARSWECQITLSVTSTTAATMSTTYSANLGPTPKIVVPYTRFSLPAGRGTNSNPNPPLWKFPFKNIFPYFSVTGNLCWDWRQRNAGTRTTSPMDAVRGTLGAVMAAPNFGTGCTATGRSAAAKANVNVAGGNITMGLTNGAASAAAFLAIGLRRVPVSIGWCAPIYTTPQILIGGTTDAGGSWRAATTPSSVLTITPYTEVYAQFAFADAGLAAGLGLSDLGIVTSPPNGGSYVSRVWTIGSTNGSETATTGSIGRNYGLVTMFTVL